MPPLSTQVPEDDWVDSFIACMYINLNQYLLFCPMKSMGILQADGLRILKNQWLFEWSRELGRVKAASVLSIGGSQSSGGHETDPMSMT